MYSAEEEIKKIKSEICSTCGRGLKLFGVVYDGEEDHMEMAEKFLKQVLEHLTTITMYVSYGSYIIYLCGRISSALKTLDSRELESHKIHNVKRSNLCDDKPLYPSPTNLVHKLSDVVSVIRQREEIGPNEIFMSFNSWIVLSFEEDIEKMEHLYKKELESFQAFAAHSLYEIKLGGVKTIAMLEMKQSELNRLEANLAVDRLYLDRSLNSWRRVISSLQ